MTSPPSPLDTIGREVTSIVTPVSVCMALTVLLVRTLNPEGKSNDHTVAIATAYYHEEEGDSAGTRFWGAMINALVFVAIVALMTFILVLLFKYGYTRFIYGYMAFAGFSIFFMLTGIIAALLIQKLHAHLDYISFFFILYNFATVGVCSLFYLTVPITLKQGYLVVTGVVTAYIFTWIPAWTTWMVLIAMSLYDLAAVLSPVGPLKMLVELAQERDEDIPALVYEGRPVGRAPHEQSRRRPPAASQEHVQLPLGVVVAPLTLVPGVVAPAMADGSPPQSPLHPSVADTDNEEDGQEDDAAPLLGGSAQAVQEEIAPDARVVIEEEHHHRSRGAHAVDDDEEDDFLLPDAIKLGLGDFIFYSVLVARAAMHDLLTAFASYTAIVAGLGMTLMLLGLYQKALPALPISIALGLVLYACTRVLVEPVVVSCVV